MNLPSLIAGAIAIFAAGLTTGIAIYRHALARARETAQALRADRDHWQQTAEQATTLKHRSDTRRMRLVRP